MVCLHVLFLVIFLAKLFETSGGQIVTLNSGISTKSIKQNVYSAPLVISLRTFDLDGTLEGFGCESFDLEKVDDNPRKKILIIYSPTESCLYGISELLQYAQEKTPESLRKTSLDGISSVTLEYDYHYWYETRQKSSYQVSSLHELLWKFNIQLQECLVLQAEEKSEVEDVMKWSLNEPSFKEIHFAFFDSQLSLIDFFSIAEKIRPKLEKLNFMDYGVMEKDGLVLAKGMEYFPSLRVLNLEEAEITSESALAILKSINQASIEHLRLSFTGSASQVAQYLAQKLEEKSFKKLKFLTFEAVDWCSKDLVRLLHALKYNSRLSVLSLGGSLKISGNSIDELLASGSNVKRDAHLLNEILGSILTLPNLAKLNFPEDFPCRLSLDHYMSRIRKLRPSMQVTIGHSKRSNCFLNGKVKEDSLLKLVLDRNFKRRWVNKLS